MAGLLSASLIVKNEAEKLGRCLESLVGVVDEIVVVDTGSTDSSVAIAESYGARVFHRPWDGDFSPARNFGLDHVTGTWVLYVDADEYLQSTTRAFVEEALVDPDNYVAYRIRLRHRQGFTPYFEFRIWRNRPDIRFWGVIHESVVPQIGRIANNESLLIGHAELLLEHDGYEGDQSHKHQRDLPLLLEQVKHDPNRTYLWDNIGRIYEELGNEDEARRMSRRGIELVRSNGSVDPADSLVYFDLIMSNSTKGIVDRPLVEEAKRLFPTDILVLWGVAMDAIVRHANAEVVDAVNELLSVPPEVTARGALGVNERLTHEWSFHARGMALFKMGDFAGAAADFATAEAFAPEVVEYRTKRRLAQARMGSEQD